MYKKTIGLEIHAQINTKTKLFSRALIDEYAESNENVDFLDAGFPGTLPVPNQEAIFMALKTSLALNMKINEISIFDRKHYFYQDLPLGYQITQFYKPIGVEGYLDCSFGRVRINRLHIECDAGKNVYKDGKTYVDLNRSGVPLMEIVTEPDLHDEKQTIEFLKELKSILLCIKTCKCDMEMGNFRADVNISVAKQNEPLGVRVEIKNLNSFSSMKKAIEAESLLQINILQKKQKVLQETKLFDLSTNKTKTMRTKEDAWDYKYFPDPDLLPVHIDKSKIEECKNSLPKLPQEIRKELRSLGITKEQSYTLTETTERYNFFNSVIKNLPVDLINKVSNWFCCELIGKLSKINLEIEDVIEKNANFADIFSKIIMLCENGEITRSVAKEFLDIAMESDKTFKEIAQESNLLEKKSFDIDLIIREVLDISSNEIEKFKKGKKSVIMYFVGQVMKITQGQCNADEAKKRIEEEINKR